MIYITVQQVLYIHSKMIDKFGGSHGVRDLNLLISALARANSTFDGVDLYPTIQDKAALIHHQSPVY